MEMFYTWWQLDDNLLFNIRVAIPYSDLKVPSLVEDWDAITWHEREACEMLGIDFPGNPNLTQFLLPDELVGTYPMRKSFKLREK